MISIIAAVAPNLAIGKDNKLLWHISEDLKYFKKTTAGHTVIMGYNTFLSLNCKPLPNRTNIVITKRIKNNENDNYITVMSLEAALGEVKEDEEVFIIGGGMLYKSSIQLADKLYITQVDINIEDADTFFPEIDPSIWREDWRSETMKDEKTGKEFRFVIYLRKTI